MLGVEAVARRSHCARQASPARFCWSDPFPAANLLLLLSHQLTPLLGSPEQVQMLGEFTRQPTCKLDVHLKFDTGMHRQGIMRAEFPLLLDLLAKYPGL